MTLLPQESSKKKMARLISQFPNKVMEKGGGGGGGGILVWLCRVFSHRRERGYANGVGSMVRTKYNFLLFI